MDNDTFSIEELEKMLDDIKLSRFNSNTLKIYCTIKKLLNEYKEMKKQLPETKSDNE